MKFKKKVAYAFLAVCLAFSLILYINAGVETQNFAVELGNGESIQPQNM